MAQAQVLITDDDSMTLEMLEASLQGNYQVTTAVRGKDAIRRAQSSPPDVIVLDVDMPELDGYATCEALKADSTTVGIPVIFLSARCSIDERLKGYRVGAHDYLTKPFDADELRAKVELAISKHAHSEQLRQKMDEAMGMVMGTADMYGELGLVLKLQRELSECHQYVDIASAFFGVLMHMGLEGCLRLSGRLGMVSRTPNAACSALENAILDHVEAAKHATIQKLGENTSFRYENVAILVRPIPGSCHTGPDAEERQERMRDNIAMMAEGIVSRLRSIDSEHEKAAHVQSQRQVQATREAMVDIAAEQHANRIHLGKVFERLQSEIEYSFINLGLSATQEELLSTTLRRHVEEAMAVFDHSSQIQSTLNKLIERLGD
jgi:CheY-like chemotaxis protein